MHDGLWGATHDSKEVRGFELIWLLGGFLSMANLFSLSRHFKILVITLLSFGICLERAEKALSMIEELLRICVIAHRSPA
jgi:hypothetical protein